jgi:hypothetical protein
VLVQPMPKIVSAFVEPLWLSRRKYTELDGTEAKYETRMLTNFWSCPAHSAQKLNCS